MSFHHYAGIFYYVSALTVGYSCMSITVIGLICEISTIILNLRALQSDPKTCFFKFLSYSFFVTFTILRMIIFPYLFLMSLSCFIGLWHKFGLFRKIATVIYCVISMALLGLMIFWY